jgi:hypothetical protein
VSQEDVKASPHSDVDDANLTLVKRAKCVLRAQRDLPSRQTHLRCKSLTGTNAPVFALESATAGAFCGIAELSFLIGLFGLLHYGLEERRRQEAGELAVRRGVGDGEGAGVGVDCGLVDGRFL